MSTAPLDERTLRELFRSLPTGLVVLDEEGTVLLYNDQEVRLSGRTAAFVEGRNFFLEVAPCTDVRDMAGRYREAMAVPAHVLDEDFEFVFPFVGNSLDVRIRMRKIVVGERQLGVLLIDDNTRLKETERALREALGEAREMALRDALTNLHNRRYLEVVLPAELLRTQRFAYPLAVLMLDLDHFKVINDRYGHTAGDRVLVAVAQALLRALRATDFCFRVGGEEFCVVLPGTSLTETGPVVDRISEAVRHLDLELEPPAHLTVSIGGGVAEHPPFTHQVTEEEIRRELDALIRVADRSLYGAKAAGRDRVVLDLADRSAG